MAYLVVGWALPVSGATGYKITHIKVVGNATIEAESLITLSGLEEGMILDLDSPSDRIAVSTRKMAKYQGIKSVAVYLTDMDEKNKEATCVIQVEEHPKLAEYVIEGLTKKEKKSLFEQIKIPTHVTLSPTFLRNTTSKIKKYFLEKGFRAVEISTELIPNKDVQGNASLKIKINKGKKHLVDKIIFEGNQHVDSDLLRYHMIELKEAPRFTLFRDMFTKVITLKPLRKSGSLLQFPKIWHDIKPYFFKHVSFFSSLFTEAKYLKAKENIILFYKSKGFRDARIITERLLQTPTGKMCIYLMIEEGKQYKVRHIKWVGNTHYSDQTLYNRLNLAEGKPYDPIYIKQQLLPSFSSNTIGNMYYNNGYLFFRAEAVETGIEDDQVNLEIRINEGKQATINQVHIVGNTTTHEEVIRRELRTFPGDVFNLMHVQESLHNLTMLKFFHPLSFPEINPNPTGDTVDITYVVQEKLNLEIQAGLNYCQPSFQGCLTLGSENVSLKNLFRGKIPLGAAQQFSLQAKFSKEREFSLFFHDPWLWWGKRQYMFSFSISDRYRKIHYKKDYTHVWENTLQFPIEKQYKNGEIHSTGCRIVLGRQLTRYCNAQLGMGYCYHNYKRYAWVASLPKKSGTSHDIYMEILFSYDSKNNPYYPTKGCSFSNHITLTPPYTLLGYREDGQLAIPRFQEFGKYMVDFTFFKSLIGDVVFHIRGHTGFLFSLSKNAIGSFHRFHVGGTSSDANSLLDADFISLRGYPNDSLTPIDYKKHLQGGILFHKFSLEIRYLLVQSPVCIYVLGFTDVGNSWIEYTKYNWRTMKKSIGAGIRIFAPIPIIPMLGIDVGYRLDSYPINCAKKYSDMHSKKLHWHLTLQPLSR